MRAGIPGGIWILQEKGWGIYHMDVYEVTFNLYFMPKKLLLHKFAETDAIILIKITRC